MTTDVGARLLSLDASIRAAAEEHARKHARITIETVLTPYDFDKDAESHGVDPISAIHSVPLFANGLTSSMPLVLAAADVKRWKTVGKNFVLSVSVKLDVTSPLAEQNEWNYSSSEIMQETCVHTVPADRGDSAWFIKVSMTGKRASEITLTYNANERMAMVTDIFRQASGEAYHMLARLAACMPRELCATTPSGRKRLANSDDDDELSPEAIIAAAGNDPKQKKLTFGRVRKGLD
jgi:hypothetical protein